MQSVQRWAPLDSDPPLTSGSAHYFPLALCHYGPNTWGLRTHEMSQDHTDSQELPQGPQE